LYDQERSNFPSGIYKCHLGIESVKEGLRCIKKKINSILKEYKQYILTKLELIFKK